MATIGLNTYVTGFDRAIRRTVEVAGGKLRSKVRAATGDLFREDGVYQRITGGGLPQKKTTRFGDSPVSEDDYSRRRVSRSEFEDGKFMDWADVIKMGTDPKAEKLISMANKFKRQEDIVITQALLGVAAGGDNGETDTNFTDANIIDATLGASSGNAGWTYEKQLAVLESMGNNNVDLDMYRPTIVISHTQLKEMRQQDEYINLDYSSTRALDGSAMYIPNILGCDFLITTSVPYCSTKTAASITNSTFNIADTDINNAGAFADTDDTDMRICYAFVQDAALFEVNPDMTTKISERADKGFDWYAFAKMSMGAVRMEEEKVYAIPCDQSPSD